MTLTGLGLKGERKIKTIYILAREGHGPYIPCAPAIILAKRLARMKAGGEGLRPGAFPCVGLIDLDSYMTELQGLNIRLIDG